MSMDVAALVGNRSQTTVSARMGCLGFVSAVGSVKSVAFQIPELWCLACGLWAAGGPGGEHASSLRLSAEAVGFLVLAA
jgi:hypothetical protein